MAFLNSTSKASLELHVPCHSCAWSSQGCSPVPVLCLELTGMFPCAWSSQGPSPVPVLCPELAGLCPLRAVPALTVCRDVLSSHHAQSHRTALTSKGETAQISAEQAVSVVISAWVLCRTTQRCFPCKRAKAPPQLCLFPCAFAAPSLHTTSLEPGGEE